MLKAHYWQCLRGTICGAGDQTGSIRCKKSALPSVLPVCQSSVCLSIPSIYQSITIYLASCLCLFTYLFNHSGPENFIWLMNEESENFQLLTLQFLVPGQTPPPSLLSPCDLIFSYPWSNTITCAQLLPPFGIMCASVSWHFFIFLSLCHNSHLVTHTWLWRSLGWCTLCFARVYLSTSGGHRPAAVLAPPCLCAQNTLGCSVHEVVHFVGTLGFPIAVLL